MKNFFSYLWLFMICSCQNVGRQAQVEPLESSYRVISYNVENLFDTWDDPQKHDDEFTPTGANYWSKQRYDKKINDIGKVLINCSGSEAPAIIGLIEIENREVLDDLLTHSPLNKFKYKIAHEDSPDERGIDVALLYDSDQFTFLDQQIGRIQFPNDLTDRTRDILIVKGIMGRDTIYCAVNHWPSRRGGENETGQKRKFVAEQLKSKVNSILEKQPNAGIIIMGDFNDTPSNESITEGLGAGDWNSNQELIDLMIPFESKGQGTYKYQNQWNLLDQFIISRNLTDQNGHLLITQKSAKIADLDWLQEKDPMYPGNRIYRTYRGPNYVGGYSDHFPIILDIYTQ